MRNRLANLSGAMQGVGVLMGTVGTPLLVFAAIARSTTAALVAVGVLMLAGSLFFAGRAIDT